MNLDLATHLETGIDEALGRGDLAEAEKLAGDYCARAPEADEPTALSLRFRSRWLSSQVALSAGRLEEAIRRLSSLLPLPGDLPAALTCRIWLTFAEVHARLGRAELARGSLLRARGFPDALSTNPLLELRHLRTRLLLGEVESIAANLDSCRRALEKRGDEANLALLLCEEGRAWDALGRLDRSADFWRRADEVSAALRHDPIRADVLLQLGRLDHLQGHLQAALDRYAEALANTAVRPQQHEVRLRRALVLIELNQWSQARAEVDRLEHIWREEPPSEEVRPLREMVGAILRGEGSAGDAEAAAYQAARRGDMQQARALYEQALQATAAPVRRARLGLGLGSIALAAGDASEARRWLTQAEEAAREQGLPEVLWRSLLARGQLAAEIDGDEDLARELFEQAVLVSEAQARKLRHRVDAVTHGLRRGAVLRQLLRAACRRGDVASTLRYQELERGRLLVELWRSAPAEGNHRRLADDPRVTELDHRLVALEREAEAAPSETHLVRREELLLARDRLLDEYLRDRSRASAPAIPGLPEIHDLECALKPGSVYLAPVLLDEDLFLLVCPAGGPARIVVAPGSAKHLRTAIAAFRGCIDGQLARYRQGFPCGGPERRALDATLDDLGRSCLGDVLWPLLDTDEKKSTRIVWVPDAELHGVPIHALRRGGRYLIETHEVVYSFGAALVVHQARTRVRRRWAGHAVVVSESPGVLPAAALEAEGVAATFWRRKLLHGAGATREAVRRSLYRSRIVHLACHAYFDDRHPLSACVGLPSGESWRALEWLDEPLAGLPLVTLSACRSAEVAPLAGKEVFGLVTGLLASGVRGVVAGLWPVADREAQPFMWSFYRHRLLHDVPGALALAQRDSLKHPDASPLFWSAFAFFGDPGALPAPGRLTRWLARWRQRRHARKYPTPITGA